MRFVFRIDFSTLEGRFMPARLRFYHAFGKTTAIKKYRDGLKEFCRTLFQNLPIQISKSTVIKCGQLRSVQDLL